LSLENCNLILLAHDLLGKFLAFRGCSKPGFLIRSDFFLADLDVFLCHHSLLVRSLSNHIQVFGSLIIALLVGLLLVEVGVDAAHLGLDPPYSRLQVLLNARVVDYLLFVVRNLVRSLLDLPCDRRRPHRFHDVVVDGGFLLRGVSVVLVHVYLLAVIVREPISVREVQRLVQLPLLGATFTLDKARVRGGEFAQSLRVLTL